MSEESAGFEEKLDRVVRARVRGAKALRSCERLSGGASQETYRLVVETDGGERVLAMRRSPGGGHGPTLDTGPGLAIEAKVITTARAAGVPEPEIHAVLEEADGLGDGFLMEWLEGEALGARITRGEDFAGVRPRLARQCGEILARIHGIDVVATGLAPHLETHGAEDLVRNTWSVYRAFQTPQPMIDYAARWLLERLPPARPARLVHADFRNGNLMMSPEKGVIGVLDWELVHLGDPVRDLGWVCVNNWRFGRADLPVGGFGTIEDLLDGYASVSGERVDPEHVRFWMVFGSYWWAVTCLTMAKMYRSGPDRSLERVAVGRRCSEGTIDCVNLVIPGPVERLGAATKPSTLDMPRADELLTAVRDFLRDEVIGATRGRTSFFARVAGNAADIVLRELELGEAARAREKAGLERLFGESGDLERLRWKLVEALRDGSMPLDRPGLADHLRQSTADQVAIDQPKYSGYAVALAGRSSVSGP